MLDQIRDAGRAERKEERGDHRPAKEKTVLRRMLPRVCEPFDVGEDADVRLAQDEDTEASTRLVARVSPKSRIAVDSEIELAVDTARLYFFDPETRAAI